jgi:hypothetical protein
MNRASYSQREIKVKYVVIAAAALFGFCLGAFYGFNQGVHNYAALDSVLVGYMNTAQVNRLKSDSIEDAKNVRGYLLIGVDRALDQYTWYQEKGNHLLSNFFLADHVALLDKSVRGLTAFRAQNPETNLVGVVESEESKQ